MLDLLWWVIICLGVAVGFGEVGRYTMKEIGRTPKQMARDAKADEQWGVLFNLEVIPMPNHSQAALNVWRLHKSDEYRPLESRRDAYVVHKLSGELIWTRAS